MERCGRFPVETSDFDRSLDGIWYFKNLYFPSKFLFQICINHLAKSDEAGRSPTTTFTFPWCVFRIYLSNYLPDFERLKSSFRCHRVNLNRVWCESISFHLSTSEQTRNSELLLMETVSLVCMCDDEQVFCIILSDTSNMVIHTVRRVTSHPFDVGLKRKFLV